MNILILGDVAGPAGVKAVKERLPKIIGTQTIIFHTFVVKVVILIFFMHIGKNLLDYIQGPRLLKHR